jgi:hypothetical protein
MLKKPSRRSFFFSPHHLLLFCFLYLFFLIVLFRLRELRDGSAATTSTLLSIPQVSP